MFCFVFTTQCSISFRHHVFDPLTYVPLPELSVSSSVNRGGCENWKWEFTGQGLSAEEALARQRVSTRWLEETALQGESRRRSGHSAERGGSASEEPVWSPSGPRTSQNVIYPTSPLQRCQECGKAEAPLMGAKPGEVALEGILVDLINTLFTIKSTSGRVCDSLTHVCTELWP